MTGEWVPMRTPPPSGRCTCMQIDHQHPPGKCTGTGAPYRGTVCRTCRYGRGEQEVD